MDESKLVAPANSGIITPGTLLFSVDEFKLNHNFHRVNLMFLCHFELNSTITIWKNWFVN